MADLARVKRNVSKMVGMNAPETDIDSYISSEGSTVEEIRAFIPTAEPQDVGLADQQRERGAESARLDVAAEAGEITRPEAQVRKLGQFAGGVTDVVGEGATGAFHALMTDKGEERLSSDLQKLAATPVGQAGIEAIQKGGELYGEFKAENPRAAGLLEAGVNIVSLIPLVKGLVGGIKSIATSSPEGVIKQLPEAVAQAKQRVANIASNKGKEALKPDDLKTLSAEKYQQAKDAGENFPQDVRDNLITNLTAKQSGKERLTKGSNDVEVALELMEPRRNEILDLQGAQQIDEELGQLISKNYKDGLGLDGKKLLDIQDDFRTSIEKSEGGKLLKEGRDLWAASKRMEDIDRILDHAKRTDNEATSIKNGFRTLLKSDKRMRGYNAEERKMIENAANSGVVSDTLRTIVGSRLIATGLGTAFGGIGGSVAGAAISGVARNLAARRSKKGTANIKQQITERAQSGSLRNAIKESK